MDKLEKVKKIEWETVVSFKTEFLTECLAQSSFYKVETKLGLPLSRELIIDNDICHDLNQLSVSRNIIRKNIKKVSKNIFSVIERESKLFVKTSRELSLCDNKDLLKNFKKWINVYKSTVGLINVPGRLDEVLEKDIYNNLKEYKINDLEKVFRIIAHADKLSGITKEKVALMKLSLSGDDRKIKNHAQKYSWINITLLSGDLYNVQDVKNKIKNLEKNKKTLSKIEELESLTKINEKRFERIKKQYNFTSELLEKIKILRYAIWFRTARLDWLNEGCAFIRPLFNAIAERAGLTYEELIYCSPEEIIVVLLKNEKFRNKKEIYARMKKYAMWTFDGRRYNYITGDEVDELGRFLFKESKDIKKINGITASEGKIIGTVKIIKDRSEINKIKDGDILVTRLTTPDFMPAMEKAVAIITDLGGITSHAAIISRELNKPCIIGTKNATKILKDGDLVEVDADKGIIKIINKNG